MLGRFYFLLALFFHTFQTVLIKKIPSISSNFTLFDILFLRNFFSFLFLNIASIFIYSIFKDRIIYEEINSFVKIKSKKEKLKYIFVSTYTFFPTILLTIITSFLWHFGVKFIPVNNAILISYLTIIIVPLISVKIFKERNSNLFLISIIIFLFTAIFINRAKIINIFNIYYLFIFLDVFLFSALTVQRKRNTNRFNSFKILYFVSLGITVISFLFTDKVFIKFFNLKTLEEFSILFAIFIFYFLEIVLRILSIRISNVKYIEPIKFFRFIYSAILSYFILQEKLLKMQIIFILAIIIFNILIYKIEKRDSNKNKF